MTRKTRLVIEHPDNGQAISLHIEEILAITTKGRRTVQRWIDGSIQVDPDSYKLLQVYGFGIIPSLHPDWKRVYVDGDRLYMPEFRRQYVAASELLGVSLMYNLNRELKREMERMKKRKVKPRNTAKLIMFQDRLDERRKLEEARQRDDLA